MKKLTSRWNFYYVFEEPSDAVKLPSPIIIYILNGFLNYLTYNKVKDINDITEYHILKFLGSGI